MASEKGDFIQKLRELLKELFQFDCSDLDFGIYRIMNYKRKEIENFIEKDLINVVEKEFERYKTENQRELLEKIEEKKNEILNFEKKFGEKILENGEIDEKFKDKPIAQEYLELKKQVEEIDLTESIQAQVFNDLYNFFSRYYEDGDFISKRRYSSKNYRYAIPYNGEEVKLYWANYDQYYVKTGEIFKDYEFNQKGYRFVFRTITVNVPAGNVKGDKRYFILHSHEPIQTEDRTYVVNFEYRPLTDSDLQEYPVKTKDGKEKETGIKQDDLNSILKDKILSAIKPIEPKAILSEIQDGKTILEKHLFRFTRKITSDFFIHKDLKGFLDRELDYFIKTEVLDIESFDTEKEKYFNRQITRAKVVKNVGRRIIDFLSQIEDFQKMLWEKKKFVLRTEYVITLDRIPNEFHKEIIENNGQLKEWRELGFDIPSSISLGSRLPVDTKHFPQEFKERLLERLSDRGSIDDMLDGVLIKSENWQALNLLLEKYKEKVQTIYIDPPFNLGTNAGFLYKSDYKDSSWICLLENRLRLARPILNDRGSIFVRCDYNGNMYVRMLMNMIFGEENFRNEIVINKSIRIKTEGNKFPTWHDNFYFYSKSGDDSYFKHITEQRKKEEWRSIDTEGESWEIVPDNLLNLFSKENLRKDKNGNYITRARIIFGKEILPRNGRRFPSQKTISELEKQGRLRLSDNNNPQMFKPMEIYLTDNWSDIYGYSSEWNFTTENSELGIKRALESTSNQGDLILDFFLGSGTTTAVAHKLGRKWIGIEMGDHFETLVLPRMKKVLFYDKSGISKEVKEYQGGGFFKYQYLEQYEDTLHNIEFPQEERAKTLFDNLSEEGRTEYLIKYMLKFETEGSPSLLDIKQFENPFEYKPKIISSGKGEEVVNVDLVETFNYLLGLKINKYKFLVEDGRKYVFVFGERNNRKTAVIWRPTKDIDLAKDKELIQTYINEYDPDEIFINGDSIVESAKVIESEFKALMEG